MPFTPTHVLAVAPIAALSGRLPFSALAIGAMVPDLPLFFPVLLYAQTHSLSGVLYICVPTGVALFLAFQWILKEPLFALMPEMIQQRSIGLAAPVVKPTIGFFLYVGAAVAIGAYSHLLWDSFSHEGRWGTQQFSILNQTVVILGQELPGYKFVQYGSTVIGLPLLLGWMCFKILRTTPATPAEIEQAECHRVQLARGIKIAAVAFAFLIPLLVAAYTLTTGATFYQGIGRTIKTSGSLVIVCGVVFSFAYQRAAESKRRE